MRTTHGSVLSSDSVPAEANSLLKHNILSARVCTRFNFPHFKVFARLAAPCFTTIPATNSGLSSKKCV